MKFLKIFYINILVLIFSLVIVELFFGSWLYDKENYKSLLIPRQQFALLDSLPYNSDKLGIFSRDKNGFRANSYNLADINLVVVGGSTTEEREVDDNLIWTKIFEKNLTEKLYVLNAGIGGQTSYGHKLIYDLWLSKFKELNPKYILFYLGINDSLKLIEDINKNSISSGRVINNSNRDLLVNINNYDKLVQYLKNNSILHSLYKIIKGNLISRKYQISYNSKPKKFDPYITPVPKNLSKLTYDHVEDFRNYYYKNLDEILETGSDLNVEIIFITQIISTDHWLHSYLNQINIYTKEFCLIKNLKCIFLHDDINKFKNNNFYDGIHTTPEGSKLVGQLVAKKFNKILKDYSF